MLPVKGKGKVVSFKGKGKHSAGPAGQLFGRALAALPGVAEQRAEEDFYQADEDEGADMGDLGGQAWDSIEDAQKSWDGAGESWNSNAASAVETQQTFQQKQVQLALKGPWTCPTCGKGQWAIWDACKKCGTQRPEGAGAAIGTVPEDLDTEWAQAVSKPRDSDAWAGSKDATAGRNANTKPGDWTCPSCGDNVFAKRTNCRKCGSDRDGNKSSWPTEVAKGRPGDWTCPKCGDLQYGARTECRKCGEAKPDNNEWGGTSTQEQTEDQELENEYGDEDIISIPMEKSDAFKIKGEGGRMVKAITKGSGAHLKVYLDSRPKPTVLVSGTFESVDKARTMILDVLADTSKTVKPGNWEGEEYLQISHSDANLLDKENVDYIQDQTWANVEVSSAPGEKVLVRVTGSFEAIEAAFASLSDALKGTGEWAETRRQGEDRKRKRRADGDAGSGQKRKRSTNDTNDDVKDDGGPKTEERMTLGKNAFGIIVGKGGDQIKWLRKESGAEVKAEKDEGKTKTEVSIKGTPEQVEIASEMIRGLLKSAERLDEPHGQSVLEVRYDKSLSGALYGRGGENIKRVKQESGAEVNITKDTDVTIVKFTGTAEQIEKAREMYHDITTSAKQDAEKGTKDKMIVPLPPPMPARTAGSTGTAAARDLLPGRSAAAIQGRGGVQETLQYPAEMAGRIIGQGGKKLTELKKVSYCADIKVTNGEDACTVEFHGSTVNRDQGLLSITKAVDLINQMAENLGFFSDKEEILTFPNELRGRMIGKQGQKLTEFKRQSGAIVQVDRSNDECCMVKITGMPICIQKAVELVKEHAEKFAGEGKGGGQQLQLRDAEDREEGREDAEDSGRDDGADEQPQLRDKEDREDAEDDGWSDGNFGEEDEDPHAASDKEWWEEENWDDGPRG